MSSLVIKIMEKYALFLILILIHFEEFLNLYTFAKKDEITINHSGRLVLLSDAKACWLWQYIPHLHMLNTVSVMFYHQIL